MNLKIYTDIFNSNLIAKIHVSLHGYFMVEIEIINYISFERNIPVYMIFSPLSF